MLRYFTYWNGSDDAESEAGWIGGVFVCYPEMRNNALLYNQILG